MTKREFLTAIVNSELATEIVDFAVAEIEKMDAKNANRKPTKKQLENEAVAATIVEFLTGKEPMVGADIASALDLTTQKVTGLCGSLVKAGKLTKSTVKLPKVGERVAYSVVTE
jgi:predicted transcriptional regulator